jgi:hypothetical protein
MELLFIHINKPYGALESKSFNLSSKFNVVYNVSSNDLTISDNLNHLTNFFGKNITNVTCVIGENGVGKTTFLRYIKELYFERRNEIDIRDGDIIAYIKDNTLIIHTSSNSTYLNVNILVDSLTLKTINYKNKPKVFDHLKNELTIYYSNNFDLYDDFVESEILYNTSTPFLSRTYNARIDREFNTKKVNSEYRFLLNEFQRNRKFLQSEKSNSIKTLLKEVKHVEISLVEIRDLDYKKLREKMIKKFKSVSDLDNEQRSKYEIYNQDESDYIFLIRAISDKFMDLKKEAISNQHVHRLLFDIKFVEIILFELTNKFIQSQSFWKSLKSFNKIIDAFFANYHHRESIQKLLRKFPELFDKNLETTKEKNKIYVSKIENILDVLLYSDQVWELSNVNPIIEVNNSLLDDLIAQYFELPFSKNYIKLEWPRLSAGEESMITFFSRMDGALRLKSTKRSNILILIDEGDLYFHPEWQRQYLKAIFDFLKQYKELNFQVILTSHSPFILSDLPQDNVITFQKTEKGIEVSKNTLSKTFGGNIHELLIDKFFLKTGIIGAFADNKIMELIKKVNNKKITKQDEMLIEEIGDKFLAAAIRTNLEESNDKD